MVTEFTDACMHNLSYKNIKYNPTLKPKKIFVNNRFRDSYACSGHLISSSVDRNSIEHTGKLRAEAGVVRHMWS